ncbi:hypothetical protein TNCV_200901 [Trichonephila clavipes]|nr:hypothetical protein TNCV_200901 [Trichonephila clavipes]
MEKRSLRRNRSSDLGPYQRKGWWGQPLPGAYRFKIFKPQTGLELFSSERLDEAHFWLNGYVNKQNCRIWSEANPQVYVEAPLNPEKLTVWCTLWAGGILLQKR